MNSRINFQKHTEAMEAMMVVQTYLEKCGLEKPLLELVKIRVSQINGCVSCLNMHTEEAFAKGEKPTRIFLLSVWRDAPIFTEREQAALAWAEAVTRIADGGVSDEIYARAFQHFTEKELLDLNLAVVAINGWNRFGISFQRPPSVNIQEVDSHSPQ